MSNEIATYSMILSKLSLGKSGTECPTKTQILAINSLIVIDNASTYGANECVKIDDIRKKAETWNYYLTVSPTSMSFGAGGGSKQFTYSSYKRKVLDGVEQSGDISVSLKTTSASGTGFSISGTTVSASANQTTSSRTGKVTLTQNESNKTATINLSQSADSISSYGEWVITVSANPTSVSSSGGTSTITASAKRTVHWASGKVTEETGNPALSTNLGSLSSSSSPSTLTLGQNTSTSSRTATIKATHSDKSATCTVTQAGAEPTIEYVFSINPWQVEVGSSGGSGSITITSYKLVNHNQIKVGYNIDRSFLPSWATYDSSDDSFTISANTTTSERRANVYFEQEESGKRDYAIIIQAAYVPPADNYVFVWGDNSTADQTLNLPYTRMVGSYTVTSTKNGSNQSWSVSSSPSWISTTTSSNNLSYTASENTGSARSGKVVLTQSGSGKTLTINVSQDAKPAENVYVFTITPNTYNATYSSASFIPRTTSTKNGSSIGYSLTSGDTDWVVVNTTGKITVEILKNTTSSTRSTTLVFTQDESGKTQSIKITQDKQPDEYIISMWPEDNTSAVYTAEPQNEVIEVRSLRNGQQQPIGVKSQPLWCTAYISTSDGKGIHHIDLAVQGNSLIVSREGTIVFEQEDSGKTTSFTVSQGGSVVSQDNKLTITSLTYDIAFLFPPGEIPVEGSNVYLSFMVPNTFTWKTSSGLTINRGTMYAGDSASVYVRENSRYKLVKTFQLQLGQQTVII